MVVGGLGEKMYLPFEKMVIVFSLSAMRGRLGVSEYELAPRRAVIGEWTLWLLLFVSCWRSRDKQ
jgi:hypothetical protein